MKKVGLNGSAQSAPVSEKDLHTKQGVGNKVRLANTRIKVECKTQNFSKIG